jgi:hypothetical protein
MDFVHAAYYDGVRYGEASPKERARIRARREKLALTLREVAEQEGGGEVLDKAFSAWDEQARSAPSARKRQQRLRSV